MRRFLSRAVLAATVALTGMVGATNTTYAAGVPGGPFATNFRIQNLGSGTATCVYTMYGDNGSLAFTSPSNLTINAGDSTQVLTTQVQGFPAGQFGGVVSCDQQVAVVVNWSDANKGDVYVAPPTTADTVAATSIYNNYFNYYTTIRVMNASDAANSFTIEYYGPGSSAPVYTSPAVSLPVNGSATVDQAGLVQLARNTSYSAKIKGTGALAAVVSIYGGTGSAVEKQLYSYAATPITTATTSYVPLAFSNYFGYASATIVLNQGTAPTDVRLTYSDSNGNVVATRTYSALNGGQKIAANSSWVKLEANEASLVRNQAYGIKVESLDGQPIAVSVNQSRGASNRAATYAGSSTGATNVVAPTVFRGYFTYNSAVTCQNVGTANTDVKISYSATSITNKTVATGLKPGASTVILQEFETGLTAGYIGSATVSSSASPVVCVVTQDSNRTVANDYFQAYVGIGR